MRGYHALDYVQNQNWGRIENSLSEHQAIITDSEASPLHDAGVMRGEGIMCGAGISR